MIATKIDSTTYRIGDEHGDFIEREGIGWAVNQTVTDADKEREYQRNRKREYRKKKATHYKKTCLACGKEFETDDKRHVRCSYCRKYNRPYRRTHGAG